MGDDEAWDRLSVWMRACSTCGGSLRTISGEVSCAMPRCATAGRVLARVSGGMAFVASDVRVVRVRKPQPIAPAPYLAPRTRAQNLAAVARRVLAYGRVWSVLS